MHLLMHHDSYRVFLRNIKSPRWFSPTKAQFWLLKPCDFWFVPKLKSPLKGKRIQTIDEIQENITGQLMDIPTKDFAECFEQWTLGELCEVPRCPVWRGLRCHCPMYNVSCILCLLSSSIHVSIIHSTQLDTFWTDLVYWDLCVCACALTDILSWILFHVH